MTELRLQIPAKMRPFLSPSRYKVAHGGRGGGKSWAIARILLARGVSENILVLCAREVQKSIKESVHRLLKDQIEAMGLGSFYDVQATTIKGANGTEFLFAGLQDHTVDSIKSYEGVDYCWVEEAHSVSAQSWTILTPTIRADDSEIWVSFNPVTEDDEAYKRFILSQPRNAVVVKINWRDNPWFPKVLDAERLEMQALNEDLYQHVWEGKCRSLAGLLFKRKWFRWYDKAPEHLSRYMASDYAVTEDDGDYTEHGIWGQDEHGDLYALDWYSDQAAPETWIDAAVGMVRRHKPQIWFEEKGQILRALDASINKRLRQRDVWILREPLASAGNKASRALGFAARASAGAVWLPKGESWATRLINQLCGFTGENGRVDDAVDVCSLLARGLDKMHDAHLPAKTDPEPILPFTRRHFEAMDYDDQEREEQKRRAYR